MRARAFSPSGLSGFFSVHIVEENLLRSGAIGGGFTLSKGITADVEVYDNEETIIENYINDKKVKASIAKRITKRLLRYSNKNYKISIKQRIEVPIGGGLGTSGASALAVGLALTKALKLPLTYFKVAQEAHITDILEKKGLGTVSGLARGGIVLIKKAGAPGFDDVDRILASSKIKIIIAFYSSISKPKILSKDLRRINRVGVETLNKILREPTLENFLENCKEFVTKTGLLTKNVARNLNKLKNIEGIIGASQAMIGNTLYAVVEEDSVEEVIDILKKDSKEIILTNISWSPARIL